MGYDFSRPCQSAILLFLMINLSAIKMKNLNNTLLWGVATLFVLGGCATTGGESIEMTMRYLPNQQVEYQSQSSGTVQMNLNSKKKKSEPTAFSSTSRYRITTSEADKNGEITVVLKVLAMETIYDGKKETDELPKPQSLKQSRDGKFIANDSTDEETTAMLSLANQMNIPKQMRVGKKYTLTVKDEDINELFSHITRDPDLIYKTKSWVKINQADEQFAWGEMYTAFDVTSPDKDDSFTLSGTQTIQFKYNRQTHLYEETHDKIQYRIPKSKHFTMSFSSDRKAKQVNTE